MQVLLQAKHVALSIYSLQIRCLSHPILCAPGHMRARVVTSEKETCAHHDDRASAGSPKNVAFSAGRACPSSPFPRARVPRVHPRADMGVAGSTQRLRPLVNPDGSIGIKVRNRLGTPRRSPARTLHTSVAPIGPLTSAHRRSHPQINKRLIQKLDGIEDGVHDAPSVRCGPSPSPRSSSRRRD